MKAKLIKNVFLVLLLISIILPQATIGDSNNRVTAAELPVAVDDYYFFDNMTLSASADWGVLSNDYDAEGDLLTAIIVSEPVYGTLTLNSDGSFTYIHENSENTTDSFTYKANDGMMDSNPAIVNINIGYLIDEPLLDNNDSDSVNQADVLILDTVSTPYITKIAFTSERDGNREIYMMNTDGSEQTRLTNNTAEDREPAWSPDGTTIAFMSYRDGNYEVYMMNANGSVQTKLTTNPASDGSPAWSPDGTKIAFISYRDGNPQIYVMNANGSSQSKVTTNSYDDLGRLAWSPDGSKILFTASLDGNYDIYVMNADGTGQTRLTDNVAVDSGPAHSPYGNLITFISNRDGNYEIYAMNSDGSAPNRLTSNNANDAIPSWSPDGSYITFYSDRDGNEEIYVMNADGSNQINLTNNPANDWGPVCSPFLEVAAYEDLIPYADGSLTQLYHPYWPKRNPNHFLGVVAPNDGDTVGWCVGVWGTDTFYYPNLIRRDDSIKKIKVYKTSWANNNSAEVKNTFKIGGRLYHGIATFWSPSLYRINPATGVAWTVSDIDNLELGVSMYDSGMPSGIYVDALRVRVIWENAAVRTEPARNYTGTSATLRGYCVEDEGVKLWVNKPVQIYFQWGGTTAYGHTTSPQNAVKGDTITQNISGLNPAITYHYRAVIYTDAGEYYCGEDRMIPTGLFPDFTWSPQEPEPGEEITFDASNSEGDIISYRWDFGDNTPNGYGEVVTHNFQNAGDYTVILTLTTFNGKTASISRIVSVRARVTADFTWSPQEPETGEEITFDASSSVGQIINYTWDFGDDTPYEYDKVVTHSYQNSGEYDVTLIVYTTDGNTASICKTVSVRAWSFAVITDLHIGREFKGKDYDGAGWNDSNTGQENLVSINNLKAAIYLINLNREKFNIKFVAVLGDLTESAELSELYKAREILNKLDIPWIPLIGNHDVWPYCKIDEAPEVGPNNEGTDLYFAGMFQSQYNYLSTILQNWEKADVPVWNPKVYPDRYSYFQNFAFDYKGYHFIGLDFVSREHAPRPKEGVPPEGDLHNFSDESANGTWVWFTNHLQQYVKTHPESKENIILLAHHPFNKGIVSIVGFKENELDTMFNFLKVYKTQIFAEFAGHTHQNKDFWWHGDVMRTIETDANKEDPLVRIVQIISGSTPDYSKFLPENGISFKAHSPVDLIVTDPDNLTISKELNEIPGASYQEIHLDEDGTLDDLIQIPERKIGEYTIEVIPEPSANVTDTYTLDVSSIEDTFGWISTILADNVSIENIPPEPYVYYSAVRQNTQLTYTGATSGINTFPVSLSALFVDENGVPLPGKNIVFEIGAQSASAVTDESGVASATLTPEQEPGMYYYVDASFAGDEYYMPSYEYQPFEIIIPASVDYDPDTLNLKSQGQWITAYIELPSECNAVDIDLSSILLNGTVPAVTDPQYGFVTDPNSYITDSDSDGIMERMVKFDREAVKQLVNIEEDLEEVPGGLEGEIQLIVSGTITGLKFEGSSIIAVILKGK